MKKLVLKFICLVACANIVSGQDSPHVQAELPHVVPPSPTVAALMKFEEFPVNNHTGTPNISIPLYGITALDNKFSISLSLNYHPASAAASEVASNVGLGWSLLAGGSISRTVRGLPDEIGIAEKYGVRNPSNNFDIVLPLAYPNATPAYGTANFDLLWGYAYMANMKGKRDAEYDLYQYNFCGNTGRFFVNTDNQVVKLDDSTLKIIYNSGSDDFTIIDDNGYKFIFTIKESSQETTGGSSTYCSGNTSADLSSTDSNYYVSAYHLKSVFDISNNLLVNFEYEDIHEETVENRTETYAESDAYNLCSYLDDSAATACVSNGLQPSYTLATSSVTTRSRSLKSIDVKGKGKIEFSNSYGRIDSNIAGQASKLNEIAISAEQPHNPGDPIYYSDFKRFKLKYSYSNVVDESKRLVLDTIIEQNYLDNGNLDELKQQYVLEYKDYYQMQGFYNEDDMGMDHWGYFNDTRTISKSKETSKQLCDTDMLQKITYPSGGCAIFEFEPNTYAAIVQQELTNFDENPDNWNITTYEVEMDNNPDNNGYSSGTPAEIMGLQDYHLKWTLSDEASYYFYPPYVPQGANYAVHLWQFVNNVWNDLGVINCNSPGCEIGPYPKGDYRFVLNGFNIGVGNQSAFVYINVGYQIREKIDPEKEWLYGGGVRINRIGYFDVSVDKNYYEHIDEYAMWSEEDVPPAPVKEKVFSYQYFNNALRSSGVLGGIKPKYTYNLTRKHTLNTPSCAAGNEVTGQTAFNYTFTTEKSSSPKVQSQGAYVTYENVTVSETGNGRQTFKYTSPHTETNEVIDTTYVYYPFIVRPMKDYNYGLLLEENVYAEGAAIDHPLVKTNYEYYGNQIINEQIFTGIKFYTLGNNDCPFTSLHNSYESYVDAMTDCINNPVVGAAAGYPVANSNCVTTCGELSDFITYTPIFEYVGWRPLKKKVTEEYFYDGDDVNIVQNKEEYTYNELNKKISTVSKEVYSSGTVESLRSEYTYYLPANYLQNNFISDIDNIKSYRNERLLDTKKVNHNASSPFRIQSVSEAKGAHALEMKVEFLSYDTYGRPAQVKKTNGNTISYLWGYNKTQPIAMIENATYQEIADALQISSVDVGNLDESDLLQISTLRTLLPNARVSTYTYIPLVGVLTQTDARGYLTTYEYDVFGRLKSVQDAAGNIISENNYHYRPLTTE